LGTIRNRCETKAREGLDVVKKYYLQGICTEEELKELNPEDFRHAFSNWNTEHCSELYRTYIAPQFECHSVYVRNKHYATQSSKHEGMVIRHLRRTLELDDRTAENEEVGMEGSENKEADLDDPEVLENEEVDMEGREYGEEQHEIREGRECSSDVDNRNEDLLRKVGREQETVGNTEYVEDISIEDNRHETEDLESEVGEYFSGGEDDISSREKVVKISNGRALDTESRNYIRSLFIDDVSASLKCKVPFGKKNIENLRKNDDKFNKIFKNLMMIRGRSGEKKGPRGAINSIIKCVKSRLKQISNNEEKS